MTLSVREETGITEGATLVCTVEIITIMIELTSDEGHGDYISDETDDNDDVLSAFISPPHPPPRW